MAAAVVLDNGGHTLKLGVAGEAAPRRVSPNTGARPRHALETLYGGQIDQQIQDQSQLVWQRPIERGYVVDWNVQTAVWERELAAAGLAPLRGRSLLVTAPPLGPPAIGATMDEVVFEELGAAAYCRPAPAACCAPANAAAAALVVDCGFSFAHATPLFHGVPILAAIRRVNVGGKLLTNYLKELVSYRHFNVMDETRVMTDVKHALCFVADDLPARLAKRDRGALRREFVLPDYQSVAQGYARDAGSGAPDEDLQVLALDSERVVVPELLFRPSDIGIDQGGVVEAALEAVRATSTELHGPMLANVLLTGGCTRFPGFVERFTRELRAVAPDHLPLGVALADDPVLCAWQGAAALAADAAALAARSVTSAEYSEVGSGVWVRRGLEMSV